MITTHDTKGALGCYAPPKCIVIRVTAEGVLCSSIEGLDKEFEFNPWAAIEE